MSGFELRDVSDKRTPSKNQLSIGLANLNTANTNQLPEVVIMDSTNRTTPPIDRYNLVFIILLIHGVGSLMPWNMFINAENYFRNYKLKQTSESTIDPKELDDLRQNFMPYLGFCAQLPNVLFNLLNLFVQMGSGNLKMRVNITLIIEAIVFVATIVLAVLDSFKWQLQFFYLTMASVVVLNMASGIYQNCIFGTGAKFPGQYTMAILVGSNFSGTFTSVVNLLAIWLAPAPQEAAIYYFATALFVILICIITYNLLPLNNFFRHYDQPNLTPEPLESLLKSITQQERDVNDNVPESLRRTVDAMDPRSQPDEDNTCASEARRKWAIFLKCWPQCLNVFLTFFVTLALFPTVLADVKALDGIISDTYFAAFGCFFIFNFFAMIGNIISNWTTWPGKDNVWILVVARFLLIPFFLFCNFQPAASRVWPVIFKSDLVYILGNIILALSSGYLSSLCMMFAPDGLRPEEAPKAGMIAAFFLVFGIFCGVYSSMFLVWIVQIG